MLDAGVVGDVGVATNSTHQRRENRLWQQAKKYRGIFVQVHHEHQQSRTSRQRPHAIHLGRDGDGIWSSFHHRPPASEAPRAELTVSAGRHTSTTATVSAGSARDLREYRENRWRTADTIQISDGRRLAEEGEVDLAAAHGKGRCSR